jgi:AmiR/NasT family two-component response regulator
MPCNALIVMRKPELAEQIRLILVSRGYTVSGVCASGAQGLQTASSHVVDVAIVGFSLVDMSGLDFAMNLLEKEDCSVMLLTPPEQIAYVKEQAGKQDIVALQKPSTAQAMLSTLELMQHYRSRLRHAGDEAKKLRADLDRRALAEKAKVALMHAKGMSEAEAWRYLQKRAMDTGRTLQDTAEQVLRQLGK